MKSRPAMFVLAEKVRASLFVISVSGLFAHAAIAQEWRSAISAGDYDRAREELAIALIEAPDDTTLRYQLARVLGYSGMNRESLAEFESLLSRFPDNADYLLGRAQMLGRLGRTEEALEVTEHALSLAPDYQDVWQLRMRLADQSLDRDLSASVRAEAARRYPNDAWWQKAPPPLQYTRWLSSGWEHAELSNNSPDWSRQFLRLDWRQSEDAAYFGEIARSSRFDRSDFSLSLGADWQALPLWRIGGALARVGSADFEAKETLSMNAGRSWQSAWGTQFRFRRREYSTTTVSSYSVTGDKYFSDYRVAYGLNYSRLHGAASSLGHSVSFGWYPAETRSMAISFGAGEEIETIGIDRLLRTRVKSVTLSGRQGLTRRFDLNWWLGTHRQGDFYRRTYAGISVRIAI